MSHDAFISYCSEDKLAADATCAVLESSGIRCWIAPRDILPGSDWPAAIIDAIDRSRLLILIFSSSANGSAQIRREVERAVNKGITIVPVRIERVEPARSLAYFMAGVHWLDALPPPLEQHLRSLAQSMKAFIGDPAVAGGVSEQDPSQKYVMAGRTRAQAAEAAETLAASRRRDGPIRRAKWIAAMTACLLAAIGLGALLAHGPGDFLESVLGPSDATKRSRLIEKIYTSGNPLEVIDAVAKLEAMAETHSPQAGYLEGENSKIVVAIKGALSRQGRGERETRKAALEALARISQHNLSSIPGLKLSGIDLVGTNFLHSDMHDMDLSHSFIIQSDFRGTNLKNSDWSQSHVRNSHIANASVAGLDLSGSDWFNIVDLSDEQFAALNPVKLVHCPEGYRQGDEAFIALINKHYLIKFGQYLEALKRDLRRGWAIYRRPNGPCEKLEQAQ